MVEQNEAMCAEDGVRAYSVVSVAREGACSICWQDVLEAAELACTEIYDDGSHRRDALYICQGCAYRVGALFAPHNAGKELYNGSIQPAA